MRSRFWGRLCRPDTLNRPLEHSRGNLGVSWISVQQTVWPKTAGNGQDTTRWWFHFFYFHPHLGKIPILTNIFQMGWNHHLDKDKPNLQWRSVFFKTGFPRSFPPGSGSATVIYCTSWWLVHFARLAIGLVYATLSMKKIDLSGIFTKSSNHPLVLHLLMGWKFQPFWGWGFGEQFGESLSSTGREHWFHTKGLPVASRYVVSGGSSKTGKVMSFQKRDEFASFEDVCFNYHVILGSFRAVYFKCRFSTCFSILMNNYHMHIINQLADLATRRASPLDSSGNRLVGKFGMTWDEEMMITKNWPKNWWWV